VARIQKEVDERLSVHGPVGEEDLQRAFQDKKRLSANFGENRGWDGK
jgi:hypothetical protein